MSNLEAYHTIFFKLSIWFLPGLFAITVHEAAHGLAALWLGDKTAFFLGRTSLNPSKHIDPVGTILIPCTLLFFQSQFLFGWAKPVPINLRNFKNPLQSMAIVAAAGPAANFIMAVLWFCILKITFFFSSSTSPQLEWLQQTASIGVLFNIVLAVFNLLPVPPLDGSKIIQVILPRSAQSLLTRIEPYGLIIIVILLFTGLLPLLISTPVVYLLNLFQALL